METFQLQAKDASDSRPHLSLARYRITISQDSQSGPPVELVAPPPGQPFALVDTGSQLVVVTVSCLAQSLAGGDTRLAGRLLVEINDHLASIKENLERDGYRREYPVSLAGKIFSIRPRWLTRVGPQDAPITALEFVDVTVGIGQANGNSNRTVGKMAIACQEACDNIILGMEFLRFFKLRYETADNGELTLP